MLRYTQALTVQMSQTALCRRHHGQDQQLCRQMLVSLDRISGSTLQLAGMLDAPAQGLSAGQVQGALQRLQAAGAVDCQLDQITVLRATCSSRRPANATVSSRPRRTGCCPEVSGPGWLCPWR